jgi:TPR repeat protein
MRRAWARASCLVLGAAALGACGTHYDPGNSYVRGLRFFDRGQFANAMFYWKPLAEAGDCDAAYRYGVLFALGAGVPKDLDVARDWWTKAANQGNYRAQVMLAMVAASQWLHLARELWPRDVEAVRQQLELEIMALDVELTADQKAEAALRVS